jgi:hypothetical protein
MPISTIGSDGLASSSVTSTQLAAGAVAQVDLATGVAGTGPAFRAYNATGTVTLPGNTDTKITFDTEDFDTNGNFASSRFTSTVAGYYQVNGAITVNFWNGNILTVSIYKNGSVYARGNTGYPQTVGGVRVNVGDIVYLNGSTDYIELYGYQYNQATSNVTATGSNQTYFSAALVRAA